MRIILAAFAVLASSTLFDAARADPYHWCAEYAGAGMEGSNCYFMTEAQCKAQVSGVGGFCRPNPYYDGKPVVTPEDRPAPRRRGKRGVE